MGAAAVAAAGELGSPACHQPRPLLRIQIVWAETNCGEQSRQALHHFSLSRLPRRASSAPRSARACAHGDVQVQERLGGLPRALDSTYGCSFTRMQLQRRWRTNATNATCLGAPWSSEKLFPAMRNSIMAIRPGGFSLI